MYMRGYCAVVLVILAMAQPLPALILYEDGSSTDNTFNAITPGNPSTYPDGIATGAPWENVIDYGNNNGSAIYLGHGFTLTARHVAPRETSNITINGINYNTDPNFDRVRIILPDGQGGTQSVDMRVDRIDGNPGLAPLQIAGSNYSDVNKDTVIVGAGRGKGAYVTDQGWQWGDSSTFGLRWGLNRTGPDYFEFLDDDEVRHLYTFFFPPYFGADTAASANGDSGGAFFQKDGNDWLLIGLIRAVSSDSFNGTRSFYDEDPQTLGFQGPDNSFAIRLGDFAWVLRYDHWKEHHGIPLATADDNDDDEDGVPLLLEYILGMDPNVASAEGLPQSRVEGTNLILTYSRLASVTDVAVEIETNSTLDPADWDTEPVTYDAIDESTVFQTIEATIPLNGRTLLMARIKATRL